MIEALRVKSLKRSFSRGPAAVDQVDLSIEAGRFFCLLGPSGCGKTTLLRLIGGYLTPDAGQIWIGDRNVTHEPPERRNVGMVFQNYALFPHMTAGENVAFGLSVRGLSHKDCWKRVEEVFDRVGLSDAERKRYPRELSGGQQQRVAVARALVIEPQLLLLDEPLANLDRKLREKLRGELREIQRRTGVTTILVTHDQDDALSLADDIGLMLQGQFLQIGSPADLYHCPKTPFVARFVGEANLLQVEAVTADHMQTVEGLVLKRAGLNVAPGSWLLIRPETCVVGTAASQCSHSWPGRVLDSTFLGSDRLLELEISPSATLKVRGRPEQLPHVNLNDQIPVGFSTDQVWVIPDPDPLWAIASLQPV